MFFLLFLHDIFAHSMMIVFIPSCGFLKCGNFFNIFAKKIKGRGVPVHTVSQRVSPLNFNYILCASLSCSHKV